MDGTMKATSQRECVKGWVCFGIIFLSAVLLVDSVNAEEWYEMIQKTKTGTINWSTGAIQARGSSKPVDESPEARTAAMQDARKKACHNLLETIRLVRINSATMVLNNMGIDEKTANNVETLVKDAAVVDTVYLADGTIEETVQLQMRDELATLLLPKNIQQFETINFIATGDLAFRDTDDVYTGLVVDAKGLNATPAMAPKIIDENGQEIFGSSYVSREFAIQQGMIAYSRDVKAASENSRVAGHPLVVEGMKVTGAGLSDIVISSTDAALIKGSPENLLVLKKCRVMIVLD